MRFFPASKASAREVNADVGLRWIMVDDTHYILTVGGKSGHIHLEQWADTRWRLRHVCPAGGSEIATGLPYPVAKRLAERYVKAMTYNVSATDPEALWRAEPMFSKQRARLTLLLGEEPDPNLTAGEASDLFQKLTAIQADKEAAK